MALDPSIALQVKPLQLDNPMNAMAMYSQIQGTQQANQLNQMKMAEYERARTEDEGIRNYLAGVKDVNAPETRTGLLKFGKSGLEYGKALTEQQKAGVDRQAAETKLVVDRTKMSRDALDSVNTPEEYLAWHEANHRDPILGPALAARGVTADTSRANIMKQLSTPGGFEKLIQQSKLGAEKYIERTTQTAQEKATVGATLRGQDLTNAATLRGQDLTNARAQENLKIAQESQRREADPVFQQQIAEAKTLGQTIAKDKVVRAAQLPKVLDTAEMTLREVDDLIGKRDAKGNLLKGEKPHPGFETAVGFSFLPGARFVPGAPAADFQARFDQVKGGAFLQAFETLKGGGSITNVEGDKGTAALNRMGLAQSEKEFVQAAREFQDVVRTGVARAKKMSSGSATAGGGDVDTSNPLLKP
jgi:hypothetical protein